MAATSPKAEAPKAMAVSASASEAMQQIFTLVFMVVGINITHNSGTSDVLILRHGETLTGSKNKLLKNHELDFLAVIRYHAE
jgi:hypothetical protein